MEMKTWTLDEVRAHFREVLGEMAALKTPLAIDQEGTVWAFGRWYGEVPHFRTGFGHWSETVLEQDYQFARCLPLRPHVSERQPTESDLQWVDFYLRKPD